MLEEADLADACVEHHLEEPRGELRISASVLVGQEFVTPALPSFLSACPDVAVVLSMQNRRIDLIEEGFDVAIRAGSLDDSTLIARRVSFGRVGLYASPAYLARYPVLNTFEDLEQHQILGMSDVSRRVEWKLSQDGKDRLVKLQPRLVVNDFATLRHLAANASGLVLLPEYAAFGDVSSGALKLVAPHLTGTPYEINAVYPSRRGAAPKVKAFVEHLRNWSRTSGRGVLE